MRLIQTDEEDINSKDKNFIKDLKELSTQHWRSFIVFDKKDIALKINIDKIKMKKSKQKYCSKVDAKINDQIKSEDIICMLEHIPNHLTIRLEANKIDQIIKLMKSKTQIEKLKEQGTKILHKDIEIEPRIIESKMDENNFKKEISEIEAKRDRLNMDCDE